MFDRREFFFSFFVFLFFFLFWIKNGVGYFVCAWEIPRLFPVIIIPRLFHSFAVLFIIIIIIIIIITVVIVTSFSLPSFLFTLSFVLGPRRRCLGRSRPGWIFDDVNYFFFGNFLLFFFKMGKPKKLGRDPVPGKKIDGWRAEFCDFFVRRFLIADVFFFVFGVFYGFD